MQATMTMGTMIEAQDVSEQGVMQATRVVVAIPIKYENETKMMKIRQKKKDNKTINR